MCQGEIWSNLISDQQGVDGGFMHHELGLDYVFAGKSVIQSDVLLQGLFVVILPYHSHVVHHFCSAIMLGRSSRVVQLFSMSRVLGRRVHLVVIWSSRV
jgi:hypothetical protein